MSLTRCCREYSREPDNTTVTARGLLRPSWRARTQHEARTTSCAPHWYPIRLDSLRWMSLLDNPLPPVDAPLYAQATARKAVPPPLASDEAQRTRTLKAATRGACRRREICSLSLHGSNAAWPVYTEQSSHTRLRPAPRVEGDRDARVILLNLESLLVIDRCHGNMISMMRSASLLLALALAQCLCVCGCALCAGPRDQRRLQQRCGSANGGSARTCSPCSSPQPSRPRRGSSAGGGARGGGTDGGALGAPQTNTRDLSG